MTITIQAVERRLQNVELMLSQLNGEDVTVHVDKEMKGSFGSFVDMLSYEVKNDYRLHLQDDVILSPHFKEYLPYVEEIMNKKNIHLLSLYAPRRKSIHEAMNRKEKISVFENYSWLQGTVFSKKFVELMRLHLPLSKQTKHDDTFVREVLHTYKIKAYVHLPCVIQHNVEMVSVMGHGKGEGRRSIVYDENYITNFLNKENEKL